MATPSLPSIRTHAARAMSVTLRRALIWGPVALAIAAGLVFALSPRPVPVDLGEVVVGPLTVTSDEEGRTRVRDVFTISAPVTGILLRVGLDPGDPIVAGETVLARMEPVEPTLLDIRSETQAGAELGAAEAGLALAAAEVDRARAELAFAETELSRAERLYERETVAERAVDLARKERDTRRAALKTAEANREVKRQELERARAQLIGVGTDAAMPGSGKCCVTVTAPITGKVLRVLQESARVVASGTPLMEVGDPRQLEIVVELLSTEAVRIRPGARVAIEHWGGDSPLAGRVRRIEPFGFTKTSALGVEEQRVNVLVDLVDPPAAWAALEHGYRVEVRIVVWHGDDVLKAPLAALYRHGGDWATFRVRDGTARRTTVGVRHMNGREAEVIDGLAPGDRLVLHPSDRIEDGTPVVARDAEERRTAP